MSNVYKGKNNLKFIRITEETLNKIKRLSRDKKLKQITVLEYLLSGKIKIEELI